MSDPITYLGYTTFRNRNVRYGIRRSGRRSHLYAIGKTGVGKSTFLLSLLRQDMKRGSGCGLLDPHGDLYQAALEAVPNEQRHRLVSCDIPPRGQWRFNPLRGVPDETRPLVTAGVVDVFKKLWTDSWGPRLEHILRNIVATLLCAPGGHLGMIPRLLFDDDYREKLVQYVEDASIRGFWMREFNRLSPSARAMVVAPVVNKVAAFLGDPRVRRILTEPGESLDLRRVMDEGKILLMNLSKGELGEGPSALVGSLLVSSITSAALARASVPASRRPDFYLYLDEFQTFATLSHATMLSEVRKFGLSAVLAHQYLGQLDPMVHDAVLGNVGSMFVFRIGAKDAAVFSRELVGGYVLRQFQPRDLVRMPNFNAYASIMVEGAPTKAFSMRTLG